MEKLFIITFIFLNVLNIVQSIEQNILDTDCIQTAGYRGSECNSKTTFINNSDLNFVVKRNERYFCCYYEGKLYDKYYTGCFPFKDNEIVEKNINDLISGMKKGNWEYAPNQKIDSPIIDCGLHYYKYKINNLIIILILLYIL